MKNLVLLVLFIFFPVYLLADQNFLDEFELQRINENYFGVTGDSQNIIIFGDSGDILRTTDSCKTWGKIHIADAHYIMDIIQSGYLYGVLDKNYVIKSYDNGKTWEKSFIGNYKFHRIKFYQNNLYCLAESKIIVCNTLLEKTKEYDIQIGNINGNPSKMSRKDQYDFEIINDKIYYVSDTTELTEIDIQTNKTRKINLENFGNIIRNDVPENLFRIKDKLYFTISTDLYSFSDDKLMLVQKEKNLCIWTTQNNDIFYLNSTFFTFKNSDSISFNKIIPGSNPQKINNNLNDRYISKCSFKAIKFLTDDMIIAVGMSKLIYISFNQGKNWMLVSQMDNRIYSSIFKGSGNHAMYVSDDVKFVHTSDNGITWKPQKLYSDFFFSKHIYGDLLNYGTATMFNDKGVTFYSDFLTQKGDTNLFVSEQNGDVTRFLNNDAVIGYSPGNGIADVQYHFFENNNRLFLTYNSGIVQFKWYFSFLFVFNDNMYMTRKNYFDSSHVLLMDTFSDGNIYGLTANYREPKSLEVFKFNLSLIKSTDGGDTFETEANYELFNQEIEINSLFIERVINSKDEIYFYLQDTTSYYIDSTFQYIIYGINIHTKKLSEIGRLPKQYESAIRGVQKFNSKYYFECVRFLPKELILKLFVNDDPFNEPDNWKEVENPGYSNLSINVMNDTTATIFAYDSLINNYVIWFAKPKKATSVIDAQTEIQTPIYNTSPYPNPARNLILTKIYWDMSYDIDKAYITIYDYKGNSISGRQDIDINRLNNYSGILSWDCSKYNSGLYFIMIKLGNSTRSIPVIVSK